MKLCNHLILSFFYKFNIQGYQICSPLLLKLNFDSLKRKIPTVFATQSIFPGFVTDSVRFWFQSVASRVNPGPVKLMLADPLLTRNLFLYRLWCPRSLRNERVFCLFPICKFYQKFCQKGILNHFRRICKSQTLIFYNLVNHSIIVKLVTQQEIKLYFSLKLNILRQTKRV